MFTWRYIPPFSASGSIQMAIDTWLFHQCQAGEHPPTLRFYSWFPLSLSLGHFQKQWPAHWATLVWQGKRLSLVRRPSGGRGVLHHGDLTYSLICPMPGYRRSEAYNFLCQFLIQGWSVLGQPLTFGSAGRGYHHETNCFRTATRADLVSEHNGQKFIGSAQLWRGETVLQHGSMALNPDLELQSLVFGNVRTAAPSPLQKNRNLPSFTTVIETLTQSAQQVFNIHIESQPLSQSEWAEIEEYIPQTQVRP